MAYRTFPVRRNSAIWRSGLEEKVAGELKAQGIAYSYETLTIPFVQPVKPRKYTPDFILPNGIIVETKGYFVSADRQKALMVQEQHPDLDIRFVFSSSKTRISKQSTTTYARWAESKGFQFADKSVPREWVDEPPNQKSLAAIRRLQGAQK
jgi:hypothetical protein